ncbi:phage tail protein [Lelliottia sp. AC1]|uniref:tail fiber assembly protein n=1 Tax=Lelliottia sp. AC1 TaxID=2067959 RepID=UPI002010B29B|nr:tail fiber assembly protein [Lelliottia sp. AC1]UQC72185.1 phage tail protein [Lelliottia sp. AC1]
MKNYYFDPHSAGFYVFPDSPVIPDDAVEIGPEMYAQFAGAPWPAGKVMGADTAGLPVWKDAPPLSSEEREQAAEIKLQALINQANEYMNSRQWPGKAAIGRLAGEELADYNHWLDYLDALEAVDTAGAHENNWPQSPI